MPVLEIEKIYKRKEEEEEYARTLQEVEGWKEVLVDLESILEQIQLPLRPAVPDWIQKWAEEYKGDACTLEEARRISRKFKTPLSEEVIAEREERR